LQFDVLVYYPNGECELCLAGWQNCTSEPLEPILISASFTVVPHGFNLKQQIKKKSIMQKSIKKHAQVNNIE